MREFCGRCGQLATVTYTARGTRRIHTHKNKYGQRCRGDFTPEKKREHGGVEVAESEVSSALIPELEELAGEIAGDWGGNALDSRAVILLAYKLGLRDGAKK